MHHILDLDNFLNLCFIYSKHDLNVNRVDINFNLLFLRRSSNWVKVKEKKLWNKMLEGGSENKVECHMGKLNVVWKTSPISQLCFIQLISFQNLLCCPWGTVTWGPKSEMIFPSLILENSFSDYHIFLDIRCNYA